MDKGKILSDILIELDKAKLKHPTWPEDKIHQVAIMNEEAGEATRATLNMVYENGSEEDVRKELIQTAAMCMRMLEHL